MHVPLEIEQAAMRQRLTNPEDHFGAHTVQEAKVRLTTRETIRLARKLRLKKQSSHRRYLALKRDKKKLTRSVQEELRSLLAEFHALNVEMADARRTLKGIRETREQRSAMFLSGVEMGKAFAQAEAKQQQIDNQER